MIYPQSGYAVAAFTLGLDQRLRLSDHVSLELAVAGKRRFGESWLDAGLFLRAYY